MSEAALERIREAEEEVARCEEIVEERKKEYTAAKVAATDAVNRLRALVRDSGSPGPLFNDPQSSEGLPEPPASDDPNGFENDTRKLEDTSLGLPSNLVTLLRASGVTTVCQLHDRITQGTLDRIRNIGSAKADVIIEEWTTWADQGAD